MPLVYKICTRRAWAEAEHTGAYLGSDLDRADGFIHLSGRDQVEDTARRHFAGQDDLVLVSFDADRLGDALRWEASRGGALFPHVYGALPVELAIQVTPLPRGPGGAHVFPWHVG